jgi:hypothetical protein
MDAFGIRAIHPRPERRGFSRSPGNSGRRTAPALTYPQVWAVEYWSGQAGTGVQKQVK